MSASVSAMRGGQPSTTHPIATPWLSPKVVTRKRWPKVLNDMEFHSPPCGSPRVSRGQMSLRDEDAGHGCRQVRSSCMAGEPVSLENVDHALVDGITRGMLRRCEREMCNERARGAAVGGDHRILADGFVPIAYSEGHLRIAFAPRRQKMPVVGFTLGEDVLVPCQHVVIGEPFPVPERDLSKPRVDAVIGGL